MGAAKHVSVVPDHAWQVCVKSRDYNEKAAEMRCAYSLLAWTNVQRCPVAPGCTMALFVGMKNAVGLGAVGSPIVGAHVRCCRHDAALFVLNIA